MIKKKKAQVIIEFTSMVIISLVAGIIIIGLLSLWQKDYTEELRQTTIRSYGYELQEELIIASEVKTGYTRTITIPEKLKGFEYTINNTPKILILTAHEEEFYFLIPNINGTLKQGLNMIKNQDGKIIVQ